MNFFFRRVFPLIFIVTGGATAIWGVRDLLRASASSDWPIVRGVIDSSWVESQADSEGSTTYDAEVVYRYTVEGVDHLGNRIRFGEISTSDPGDAQEIVNRYPVDLEVAVYFDRADPGDSVLEPGVHLSTWAVPGFGVIFLSAGLLMFFTLGRMMKSPGSRSDEVFS